MDNIMDPELASEMVKLLAQELKVVRAQLREAERRTSTPYMGGSSSVLTDEKTRALISENDHLKLDNAALQEKITRLQDELKGVSSMKSEEDLSYSLRHAGPVSHIHEEVARLLAENEDLSREKEEASRNHAKFSILQAKYRRSKDKVREYNEARKYCDCTTISTGGVTLSQMLNELRVTLSNCAEELEQSKESTVPEIDFRDILRDSPYEPMEGQSELSSIQPCSRDVHIELHKDTISVCEGLYFVKANEVIWSPSGPALGLVVRPTFIYNPKLHGGTWTEYKDSFDVGKQMDLCCLSGKSGRTSRYFGTYERVAGTMIIASKTLRHLDQNKLSCASRCTTLFPDLLPPSQTQMIRNMYTRGVLKLQCFVIRCVAVNQIFAERLRDKCTPSVQRPDNTIVPRSLAPSGRIRKRKREPKPVVHSTKNKKRYEPGRAI